MLKTKKEVQHKIIRVKPASYFQNETNDAASSDDLCDLLPPEESDVSYDEFNGAYGYDYDTINSAFEGDPENYWNID